MYTTDAMTMDPTHDYAYRVSCGRLIFEKNGLKHLPDEMERLGNKAFVVGGRKALECVGAQLQTLLESRSIPFEVKQHAGSCNEEDAHLLADACNKAGCNVVLGVGGGKIMDFAKIVAHLSGNPLIQIPTIPATCAALTPLSVLYDREGRCRGTWHYRHIVECVICDLGILCSGNPRYLKAGTLDSMAKMVEIHYHTQREKQAPDLRMAKLIAENAYYDLFDSLPKALAGDREAYETCVFHSVITAGFVSGIARGKFQSAIGHAFYESVRACFPTDSAPWLHGEIVAVGLLAQELYLGREESYIGLSRFMKGFGMPAAWSEIGLPRTAASVDLLCGTERMRKVYFDSEADGKQLASLMKTRMF